MSNVGIKIKTWFPCVCSQTHYADDVTDMFKMFDNVEENIEEDEGEEDDDIQGCVSFLNQLLVVLLSSGGARVTVVARWTAGQEVERAILHQGHDS